MDIYIFGVNFMVSRKLAHNTTLVMLTKNVTDEMFRERIAMKYGISPQSIVVGTYTLVRESTTPNNTIH